MIKDVKWLKPDDYISKTSFGLSKCWLAKYSGVIEGTLDKRKGVIGCFGVFRDLEYDIIEPDGVCDREPNQQKPVLR